MASISLDEIIERGKQHNNTVICEVEKRNRDRFFKIKCDMCGNELIRRIDKFNKCKKCFIDRVSCKTTEKTTEFINKSNAKHQGKYDYGLVKYQNSHIKVKIKCKSCNNIFLQLPYRHLSGSGCPVCASGNKSNTKEFILKAIKKHGNKYDYGLVDYINCKDKVKIKCNKCNSIFEKKPYEHLSGSGCPECSPTRKSNTKEFILKAIKKHGNKYDYGLVDYINWKIKIKILCNKCNTIFEQTPNKHLCGKGCPRCRESKGEIRTSKYLGTKNIKFTPQKTFETLKYINLLKYDFYLEEFNLLIEYDGIGHYKARFGTTSEEKQKNLEDIQRNDKIKDEWAKANNIPLLRIPYWDYDRIEELIEAFILEHTSPKEINQLVLEI